MNSLSSLRSLRFAATPSHAVRSRRIATATLIGRVTSAPTKRETTDGRVYYTYPLAVDQPPKRDAEGNVQRGEDGYPVHDTDWYTIFNFNERAAEGLKSLQAGSQVYVEAKISTSKSEDDEKPIYNTSFQEKRRKVLQCPKKAEAESA